MFKWYFSSQFVRYKHLNETYLLLVVIHWVGKICGNHSSFHVCRYAHHPQKVGFRVTHWMGFHNVTVDEQVSDPFLECGYYLKPLLALCSHALCSRDKMASEGLTCSSYADASHVVETECCSLNPKSSELEYL